jgi:hypothetical protein
MVTCDLWVLIVSSSLTANSCCSCRPVKSIWSTGAQRQSKSVSQRMHPQATYVNLVFVVWLIFQEHMSCVSSILTSKFARAMHDWINQHYVKCYIFYLNIGFFLKIWNSRQSTLSLLVDLYKHFKVLLFYFHELLCYMYPNTTRD